MVGEFLSLIYLYALTQKLIEEEVGEEELLQMGTDSKTLLLPAFLRKAPLLLLVHGGVIGTYRHF